MEKRIIEFETKIAFQEHTLEELNDVITEQQRQIDRLGKDVGALKSQLLKILPAAGGNSEPIP